MIARPAALRMPARSRRAWRGEGDEEGGRSGDLLSAAAAAVALGRAEIAAQKLSAALALQPANAAIRSDLAAVRLQLSVIGTDGYQLNLALAAADQAAAEAPAPPAARYNLALALELVGLRDQALREWREVLRLEPDPAWRREEMRHERALSSARPSAARTPIRTELEAAVRRGNPEQLRALVARFPQACREHLEERLLPAWAEAAVARDRTRARGLLGAARSIATALRWSHRETMSEDVVAAVARAAIAPASRTAAASALHLYARGLARLERGDFGGALPDLQLAGNRLRALDNPLALRVDSQIAVCLFQRSEYGGAEEVLRRTSRAALRRGYRELEGRCLWVLGLIAGVNGDPSGSLAPLSAALLDFLSVGEAGNAARMRCYLAEAYDLLGQPAEASRVLVPALSEPLAAGDHATRLYASFVASWLAIEQGNPRLALRFQQETLGLARADGRPEALISAFQRQALIESLLGHPERSLESLGQAAAALPKVGDLQVRRILSGDVELLRGELLRKRSPREAQRCLDRAIEVFRSTSYRYRLAHALFERALAELAQDADRMAERDLIAAVDESERQRASIQPLERRIDYLNQTRSLFERIIGFELDHGRPRAALRYSEAIKARVLLDWILVSPRTPRSVRLPTSGDARAPALQVPPRGPQGAVVIEYAMLGDRLAIFVLHGPRLDIVSVPASEALLGGLISRLSGMPPGGPSDRRQLPLEELYDLLLRPVAARLHLGDRLILVPDGVLHHVPFAALRDRLTGRYLVQDHATCVAPSLRVYIESARRDRALAGRPAPRALVIADPAFDQRLFPRLPRLSAAAAEASVVAAFAGSLALRGEAATKAAFLREASSYQLLHFAGHALVNAQYPLFSKLLFANAPGDPSRGVLYSGEMLGRRLAKTRLVVLASCSTGTGRISGSEGVESIARTLLRHRRRRLLLGRGRRHGIGSR